MAAVDTQRSGAPDTTTFGAAAPAAVMRAGTADALALLGSSRRGLDPAVATTRLTGHGPNVLPPPRRRPAALELAGQLTNMFAVMLLVAAGLTVGIYLLSSPRDVANLDLAGGIVGVVLVNAVVGFVQEHAAERTAEALQALVPRTARVVRAGEVVEVAAADLVPGDVVVLEPGDAVSADCRVVEAQDLSVEMAAITGESMPVHRISEPVAAGALADARNCVLMGTSVAAGTGKAVVFATGLDTEFGRLYRMTAAVPPEPSPLQRQVADMARRVAAVAISVGAVLFALRIVSGAAVALSFVFALGVMVALVPEGLPATLSVSLAIAVRRMARRRALIRRLAAVEALGATTVICTDKTGTLTRAEMTVQQLFESGRWHFVSGAGYAPAGEVADPGPVRSLLRSAALCCDARVVRAGEDGPWRVLGDTTEGAILVAAVKAGIDVAAESAAAPRVGTFPFDTSLRLMTTVHRGAAGLQACVKGAPEAVLARCTEASWNGDRRPMDADLRAEATAAADTMALQGLRVLAAAERTVGSGPLAAAVARGRAPRDEIEQELTFLGLVAMADPPRPDVSEAVRACRQAGIRVVMVTGDYGLTAEVVARRVGIVASGAVQVVDGAELDAMSDADLSGVLRQPSVLFARARPEHKLRIVAALADSGEVVAVTGDGANDAPALKRAAVGVAMGLTGTDVARAASVMVLLDDSFASIAAAVELGRAVYENIRRFLVYVFCSNVAELGPIVVATAVGFPLVPLSALQVLAIDLGTDVLPALALGTERPEAGTMRHPPRSPKQRLFSWSVVRRFAFLGTIQAIGATVAFFWRVHAVGLPFDAFTGATPSYRHAMTLTHASIVVSQVFVSITVRTDRESVWRVGPLSNRPLMAAGAVAVGLMALVSYLPAAQRVFHTAPLGPVDWGVSLAIGATVLAADEVRKAWHRRSDHVRSRSFWHNRRRHASGDRGMRADRCVAGDAPGH